MYETTGGGQTDEVATFGLEGRVFKFSHRRPTSPSDSTLLAAARFPKNDVHFRLVYKGGKG